MPGLNAITLVGLATMYWPGDGHNAGIRADGEVFTHQDWHIAHRRLPLGTRGVLCNLRTGLCVPVTVQDRGPFGALLPCKQAPVDIATYRRARKIKWKRKCHWWQAQTRLKTGWHYRGMFDVARRVGLAIGLRSFDRVSFCYAPNQGLS